MTWVLFGRRGSLEWLPQYNLKDKQTEMFMSDVISRHSEDALRYNIDKTKTLLALSERLSDERDMIGWLCTLHRHAVNYPNNPEARKKVQGQLNKASNLIALTYIFALLEEGDFTVYDKWIKPSDRLELKAWKHVRNTGAHAPGTRATGQRDSFDEFMKGDDKGRSGLKQNCQFTQDSITLGDISGDFLSFAIDLVKVAIGHCSNDADPNCKLPIDGTD
jgi:hypothetical protein